MTEKTKNTLLWIGLPFAVALTVLLAGPLIKLILRLAFPDEIIYDGIISFIIKFFCLAVSGFVGVLVACLMAPKAKKIVGIVAGALIPVLTILTVIIFHDMPVWAICLESIFRLIGPGIGIFVICKYENELL